MLLKLNRVFLLSCFLASGLGVSRNEDNKQVPPKYKLSMGDPGLQAGPKNMDNSVQWKDKQGTQHFVFSDQPISFGSSPQVNQTHLNPNPSKTAPPNSQTSRPMPQNNASSQQAKLSSSNQNQFSKGLGASSVVNSSGIYFVATNGDLGASNSGRTIPVEVWNNHVNPLANTKSDLKLYRSNYDYVPSGQMADGAEQGQKGVGPKKQMFSPKDLQVWMSKTPEQRRFEYENNQKFLLDKASSIILKDRDLNKNLEAEFEKRKNLPQRPATVSQEIADAPFQEIHQSLSNGDYHELVENLKDWEQEIEAFKIYKPKAELAKFWQSRFREEFIHENGLLKIFKDAKDYKIDLSSKKGREASAFINHMLLAKTELEAAASYQLLTSKADFQEIENYNLSIERERYLRYIERFTKELLSWASSPESKNTRDLESIVQDHKAFAESLRTSNDLVSVQIERFLESQKAKSYASLSDNFVKESSPFGEFGKSSDPMTKEGYQELAEILRSDETQKLDSSNLNRLDRLTQKDLERAQEGIFFTPKDSEQGKALSSGLDLAAKSVALFNENSKYLSGTDRDNYRNDYQTLSRSLAEAHILADKLWVSDQNRAAMLLGQIKPIADFTYGFALGFGLDLKENVYGVKDLVVLSGRFMRSVGSSLANSLRKVPELTLHDAEVALGNFFTRDNFSEMASSVGITTVSLYHHFSSLIKRLAEENADTLINGTAKEKGEVVGRVTAEIGLFFFPGKIIKGGVGAAKYIGSTASLIGGAAQKSLDFLAFERKAAQLAKLSGIAGAQSLKILNFAREYPSVAANVLKETSSLGAVSELAGMSAKDAKFLGKLALNVDVANKLMSKEALVSKAAIVSRESELVLKAIPKQSEKLHSLVAAHFEKSIQKLYEINLKTYYNKLGWHESLIQANMRTAIDFYASHPDFINNGVVNFEKISQHLIGIDFSKPVEIVFMEKGTRLVTWHADIDSIADKYMSSILLHKDKERLLSLFKKGNYFSSEGFSPNKLGIANAIALELPEMGTQFFAKVSFTYELSEDALILKSHSNMIFDTWSYDKMSSGMKELYKAPHPFNSSKEAYDKIISGVDFVTGGGEQFFLNGSIMNGVK